MKEIINQIGNRIKEIRKKNHFTQAELAEKINVDPKYISRLETGTSTPSIATIAKLSKALNSDISNFFIIESNEKKQNIIALINIYLKKINIKELNAILEVVSIIAEK